MFFIDIVVCTYPRSHVHDKKKGLKNSRILDFCQSLVGHQPGDPSPSLTSHLPHQYKSGASLTTPYYLLNFSRTLIYNPLSPIPWLPGVNKMLANIKQSCLGGGVWRGGGDLSNLSQMNCRLSVYCVEWRVVECLARRSVPISWHLSIPRSPLISLGGCKLTRVKTITVSSLKMKFSCVCTTLPFISLEQFPTECKK